MCKRTSAAVTCLYRGIWGAGGCDVASVVLPAAPLSLFPAPAMISEGGEEEEEEEEEEGILFACDCIREGEEEEGGAPGTSCVFDAHPGTK